MVDDLFLRMGAEFGHKFASQMPTRQARDAVASVWAERLAGLTHADISKGVAKLSAFAELNNGWPPGAAEFRALCRPHREPYERVEFQGRGLLTREPADKTTAQRYLDTIRGRVQGCTEATEPATAGADHD